MLEFEKIIRILKLKKNLEGKFVVWSGFLVYEESYFEHFVEARVVKHNY